MTTKARIFGALLLPFLSGLACSAGSPHSDKENNSGLSGSGGAGSNSGHGDGDGDGDLGEDFPFQPTTSVCGDGMLSADEACDDNNATAGDGCSADCRSVEAGFVCQEGQPCRPYAKCGDGKLIFPEQCDDGALEPGDGCSANCKLEIGWKCDGASPSSCAPTVCGDGAQEGAETCEGSDGMPFDGCSLTCQAEPQCTNDGCSSSCGDGLVIAPETCDDGNAQSGDGCSATCQVEEGYECSQAPRCSDGSNDCPLTLPIVFRDFNASHPDFHEPDELGIDSELRPCDGYAPGIAANELDANRKPTFASAPDKSCVSADGFAQWYGGTSGDYSTIVSEIKLYPNGDGGFVNHMGPEGEQYRKMVTENQTSDQRCTEAGCCTELGLEDEPWNCCEANDTTCLPCTYNPAAGCAQTFEEIAGNPLFFPLDDHPDALNDERYPAKIPAQVYGQVEWPWEDPNCEPLEPCPGPLHNFHFTSEIAYWFEYRPGTVADLTFLGDDDVWVYVNGRLALDLGGIHVPLAGRLALQGDGTVQLRTWLPPENPDNPMARDEVLTNVTLGAAELGMQPGGVYEIKVFQAERKPEGSSFQLTLSGFNSARSECRAICGDGILAAGEQCDGGAENNLGGHNGCNSDCTLGSYCGDGVVQRDDGEQCDDADPNAPAECSGCRILDIR